MTSNHWRIQTLVFLPIVIVRGEMFTLGGCVSVCVCACPFRKTTQENVLLHVKSEWVFLHCFPQMEERNRCCVCMCVCVCVCLSGGQVSIREYSTIDVTSLQNTVIENK